MSGKPETGAASATHEDRTRVGEVRDSQSEDRGQRRTNQRTGRGLFEPSSSVDLKLCRYARIYVCIYTEYKTQIIVPFTITTDNSIPPLPIMSY